LAHIYFELRVNSNANMALIYEREPFKLTLNSTQIERKTALAIAKKLAKLAVKKRLRKINSNSH
jgi:hypothetical protein